MPFDKGKSGNPGGRPKEKPFRDALRLELKAAGEDMPALRRIAKKMIEQAEEGDKDARKELADRLDGKVPQAVIGGEEDDPAINLVSRIERVIVEK